MPFPLLPLLAGGGLMAGQNYFAENEGESNSFLDSLLSIDREGMKRSALAQKRLELQQQAGANLQQGLDQIDLNDPQSLLRAAQVSGDTSFITQALQLQERQDQARVAEATRTAELMHTADIRQEDLERADTEIIVNDYQRMLQPFAEQQQNFAGLRSSLESGTAQDALTATIGIMKVLDPTSVVRSEEGRAVVAASGAMQTFANTLNQIAGKGWNDTTRREWFEAVRRVYAPAQQRAQRQITQFGNEAGRRGVDPNALTGLGIDKSFPSVQPFTPRTTKKTTDLTPEEIRAKYGRDLVITKEE